MGSATADLVIATDAAADVALHSQTMKRVSGALWGRLDAVIAAGLLALGLVEALLLVEGAPLWSQAALTLVWTVPLVWRRRWPVAVLALVIVMGPTLSLVNTQGGVMSFVLAAILAAYTVGRELDAPAAWWGPALTVGFGWVVFAATDGMLSDFVFVAVLYGGAWAVGQVIRRRDTQVGELTRETAQLRRAHAEQERLAVERERVRIARELHDIVSHSISVIAIQAQAVRRRLEASNGEDVQALRGIETTARQAMTEMRRLLGVLRAQDEPAALAPQPGLVQLPDLVAESGAAGVEVSVGVEGEPMSLAPGAGLTAYRVIQEALTNVRQHSASVTACVALRYKPDALEIRIHDGGPRRSAVPVEEAPHGGHGLVGLRERVTLCGGRMSAGPTVEGGFGVQVWLPLSRAETATP